MADKRKRKRDRVDFLGDYVTAFEKGIHTDVIVNPGGDGPGIPAHKAILAMKSKVFIYMLASDEIKTSVEKSITIPDLSYEELKALLEFFYSGILSFPNKHTRALYLAADKYDIQYLQDLCRDHFISSMSLTNVLDILELSSIPSDEILMESATRFVVRHMEEIVNSSRYRTFVRKNPDLSLDITKAFLIHWKTDLCIKFKHWIHRRTESGREFQEPWIHMRTESGIEFQEPWIHRRTESGIIEFQEPWIHMRTESGIEFQDPWISMI